MISTYSRFYRTRQAKTTEVVGDSGDRGIDVITTLTPTDSLGLLALCMEDSKPSLGSFSPGSGSREADY